MNTATLIKRKQMFGFQIFIYSFANRLRLGLRNSYRCWIKNGRGTSLYYDILTAFLKLKC